jgi:hypothetical protein
VYLTGDSMGDGAPGTWPPRHPDLFAAIAPVFGGADYHVDMSEEQLAKLQPLDRFLREKESSWSMADGLLNLPILVHHGDVDKAVNVDYSRWAVRMMQRWGYDVRYHEYPGRAHEALDGQNGNLSIEWFLKHRRNANPRHVRLRSAELRNASAYWAHVQQAESPRPSWWWYAEVVDANAIRLDTENVLDSRSGLPRHPSIPISSVRLVWNDVARELRFAQAASFDFTAAGYARRYTRARLPGLWPTSASLPFAVVVGHECQGQSDRSKIVRPEGGVASWDKLCATGRQAGKAAGSSRDTEIKDAGSRS